MNDSNVLLERQAATSVLNSLRKFVDKFKNSGSDEAWPLFYEFIIVSTMQVRERRLSISQLVKTLRTEGIPTIGDYVFIYAHGVYVVHLHQNGKIDEEFAP